jgi:hypothetical protein
MRPPAPIARPTVSTFRTDTPVIAEFLSVANQIPLADMRIDSDFELHTTCLNDAATVRYFLRLIDEANIAA